MKTQIPPGTFTVELVVDERRHRNVLWMANVATLEYNSFTFIDADPSSFISALHLAHDWIIDLGCDFKKSELIIWDLLTFSEIFMDHADDPFVHHGFLDFISCYATHYDMSHDEASQVLEDKLEGKQDEDRVRLIAIEYTKIKMDKQKEKKFRAAAKEFFIPPEPPPERWPDEI